MACPICQESSGQVEPSLLNTFLSTVECPRCGKFSLLAPLDTSSFKTSPYEEKAYLLSAVLREATESGNTITVSRQNIDDLLTQVQSPRNPLEAIDRLIMFLANRETKGFFESYKVNYSHDRSVVAARDIRDVKYLVDLATKMELVDSSESGIRLGIKGWGRADELRRSLRLRSQVFVAM